MLFAPFTMDDLEDFVKDKKEVDKLVKLTTYTYYFTLILFLSIILITYILSYDFF
tara:strand:+ start:349 stop:513 length:165 start_codon:yes stop_codon:yes gene_type:complete